MAIGQIDSFMAAIRRLESGSYQGNYSAVGVYTGSMGRARGAYQIMETNWAPWSAAAGIPGADWRNPTAQDVVARHMFGHYYRQFGSWELVAVAWFAGPGTASRLAKGDRSVLNRGDVLGTSVGTYINKINGFMRDPANPGGGSGSSAGEFEVGGDGSAAQAERERFRSIADRAGVEPPPRETERPPVPLSSGEVPVFDANAAIEAYLAQMQAAADTAETDDPAAAARATRNRLLRMVQSMSSAVREGSGVNVGPVAEMGPLMGEEPEVDQAVTDRQPGEDMPPPGGGYR